MPENSSKSPREQENLSVKTPSGKTLTITRTFGADGKAEIIGDTVLLPVLDSVAALADKYGGDAEKIPNDEFLQVLKPTIKTISMLEKENGGKTTLH